MKYLLLALTLVACSSEPPQMRKLEGRELELVRAESHTRLALAMREPGFGKPRPTGPQINANPLDWYCVVLLPYYFCPSPTNPPQPPGWDGMSVFCNSESNQDQPGLYFFSGPNENGWCTRSLLKNWGNWSIRHRMTEQGFAWNDKIQSFMANDVREIYLWEHEYMGGGVYVWTFNDNDWNMHWHNIPPWTSAMELLYGF